MFSFFKQNKQTAIREVWNELCALDKFLSQELGEFISSQTHLEVSKWSFINRPLKVLEKQRPNINYELYDFAKNQIFVGTLQPDINKLLDILREYIQATQHGQNGNVQLLKTNIQLAAISKNYLLKLNEFRDMAERLTGEEFQFAMN